MSNSERIDWKALDEDAFAAAEAQLLGTPPQPAPTRQAMPDSEVREFESRIFSDEAHDSKSSAVRDYEAREAAHKEAHREMVLDRLRMAAKAAGVKGWSNLDGVPLDTIALEPSSGYPLAVSIQGLVEFMREREARQTVQRRGK